ncbi:MAG: transglutaminase-like domain-containing protein [Polyangiales bacterium]
MTTPPSRSALARLFDADPEPRVELAALAIADEGRAPRDPATALDALDALGDALRAEAAPDAPLEAQAAAITAVLYDREGFRGNEADYQDPVNSDLYAVLARRTGIPITLAVVLIAVGRRAGLAVEGVSFPGHFLVRLGGSQGRYLDPFHRADVMDLPALQRLLRQVRGPDAALLPEHLAPVGARAIAARMLVNLKNTWERRREHARALLLCDRLVELTDAPEFVRDRGQHALALGAHAAARDDLTRYLTARPDAPDAEGVRRALQALRPARWN